MSDLTLLTRNSISDKLAIVKERLVKSRPSIWGREIRFLSFVLLWGISGGVSDAKPLKVFVLAGQSNMQGHARVSTIEHLGMSNETTSLHAKMIDESGDPRVLDDVWISYLSRDGEKSGPLTTGFGADEDKIGPELTFGITIREILDEPVLLIKTAWGGKSLHTDFRPPSAGPYQYQSGELERLAKRGEDIDQRRAEKVEATGHYYRLMIDHIREVLGRVDEIVPDFDPETGAELAGFVWFQGWNDMVDSGVYPDRGQPGGYNAYSENLAHFIRDVRRDLNRPKLPFVIGLMGVNGPTAEYTAAEQRYRAVHQNFRDAMAAPAANPEFERNVIAVLTETYWDLELKELIARDERLRRESRAAQKERGLDGRAAATLLEELRAAEFSAAERELLSIGVSNQAYHYLGSAKILGQIGEAFAEAIGELVKQNDI
ncbi:MAG: sialate O-acetylesterase [Verrucomicrobiota bacterium]